MDLKDGWIKKIDFQWTGKSCRESIGLNEYEEE
jgi:hypothetical protein